MASVAIRDVRKSFGATGVIHGVDVQIDDGEFVVLLQRLFVKGLIETEK